MRLPKLIHLGKESFRGVQHKLGRHCASIVEIILLAFKQFWIYVKNVVTFQTTFPATQAFHSLLTGPNEPPRLAPPSTTG